MTSESSSGRRDRGSGTEVGLRRLLESAQASDSAPSAAQPPHPTDHYPTERYANPPARDPETEELAAWDPHAATGPMPNAPRESFSFFDERSAGPAGHPQRGAGMRSGPMPGGTRPNSAYPAPVPQAHPKAGGQGPAAPSAQAYSSTPPGDAPHAHARGTASAAPSAQPYENPGGRSPDEAATQVYANHGGRAPVDPATQVHSNPGAYSNTGAHGPGDPATQAYGNPGGYAPVPGQRPYSAPSGQDVQPTEAHPATPRPRRPRPARPEPERPKSLTGFLRHPNARKAGIAAGAVLAVAVLGYAADWFLSSGQVPRGTVVAGVDVGGMDTAKADLLLRQELEGKADQPLGIRIDDVQTQLVPAAAGLQIDWDGTWERVGDQPANPFTRLASFFTTREVPVASTVDTPALDTALTELRVHDIPTVEGTIRFEGTRPVGVPPAQGRVLDGEAARSTLVDNWVTAESLDLPVMPAPLTVRREAVDETLRAVAQPAVSGPITFTGKDGSAALQPDQTAALLTFVPDGNGGLAPVFDIPAATAALAPQLAKSEIEPKDASFTVGGSTARVVPAVVGDKVNWAKTLEQLAALAVASGPGRTGQAIYEKVEPKLTTQAAEALRIVEPVGQFTTGGFSGPSGVNIRTVARKVNGAIVKPGETFSLNDFTGPRGAAEGYVESGIIDHGRPSTAVGGGISQFATTLYNAAYFAGLEDAGHTEHSYYISRYPAAREATVFDGAIDLKFRNNTETGIYIETLTSDSEITVRLWGTKTVNVESITGERTKPTEPNTITLPKGKDCIASEGAPGFTISDTRVITDANTGQVVSRNTRTVKYDPIPVVKCE